MSALSEALNEANVHDWSSREIARRAGGRVHHATIANVLRGKHAANPGDDLLRAFADVFPTLSVSKLRKLAGLPAGEEEPYSPPREAARLTLRQRRAVDELIRSMVTPAESADTDDRPERVEPDLAGVIEARKRAASADQDLLPSAARPGTPNLRSVKRQQDEAGEAPDPDGPEEGS